MPYIVWLHCHIVKHICDPNISRATKENKIEARLVLPVTLSYDHRVIDGGSAARFIVDLVSAFEKFDEADAKLEP